MTFRTKRYLTPEFLLIDSLISLVVSNLYRVQIGAIAIQQNVKIEQKEVQCLQRKRCKYKQYVEKQSRWEIVFKR